MGLFGKGKIFDSVQKVTGAHSYRIQGKSIVCPHCGSDRFEQGSALLNTAGMTFLNLDWANRQATILNCTVCSHVQWFLRPPDMC
ncbi:MAG: DNA-binding protein [Ignavibacteriae bacterium]|nr:MAG: DNA-binding protein [Ignavibacteriota bacterium]